VAEAARKAQEEEEERQARRESQKAYELMKHGQVVQQAVAKAVNYLQEQSKQIKLEVQHDKLDNLRLVDSAEKLDKQIEHLEETKARLRELADTVDQKTTEMGEWLEKAREEKNQNGEDNDANIDELVLPTNALHGQMLDLAATNMSYTDALYFLDRALYTGNLDCQTHLKFVRQVAKKQFLVRKHLMKVNQQLLSDRSMRGDLPKATLSSF